VSTLSREQVEALAEHLESAELNVRPVPKITDANPKLDFRDAYDVQYAIRERKEQRGNRVVGLKMGLTSRAKMKQMGVDTPIYGFLMDYFQQPQSGEIDTAALIHPKIEAEIAFVTRAPLRGPGCHIGSVLAATDFLLTAVEIIDSRYENFRFDLVSVVADNASSSRFVIGSAMLDPGEADLRTLGVVLEKNGEIVEVGAGAAVLGHPASSVALLANMVAEREMEIPAGSVILSGGITAAVAVERGDAVTAWVQEMGSVSVRFT
jgi:2-oxo-3-hexenedioate decarboxylase